jgi:hypothetical protein
MDLVAFLLTKIIEKYDSEPHLLATRALAVAWQGGWACPSVFFVWYDGLWLVVFLLLAFLTFRN